MGAAAVPVALDGLGVQVDGDVEVLSDAVHDLPGHPQLVGHVDTVAGADLDLPLAAQHLRVGARDRDACVQAVEDQGLGKVAAVAVFTAYRAVLGPLRLSIAVAREAQRPGPVLRQAHEALFLLNAEPRVLLGFLSEDLLCEVAEVSAVGLGQSQILVRGAHDQDVRSASEGVLENALRLQEYLGVVTGGLLCRGTVKVPALELVHVSDSLAIVEHLGLAAKLKIASQPDVLCQHGVLQLEVLLTELVFQHT